MKKKGQIIPFGFMRKAAAGGSSTISGHPTLNDVYAFYPCDTDANDATGTSNGTVTGAVLTTSSGGLISEAYDYDGANDVLDTNISPDTGWTDITIAAWGKFDVTTGSQLLIGTHNGSTVYAMIRYTGSVTRWDYIMRSSADSSEVNVVDSITPDTTTYHLVVMTIKSSTNEMKAYYDGSQVGTTQTWTGSGNFSSGNNFRVGLNPHNDGNDFNGKIDMPMIWQRALTDSEITDLYNSGSGLPYS